MPANVTRDKRGLSTNSNSRFSTPASRLQQSKMKKLYVQMQEKQKAKSSKDGSSNSVSIQSVKPHVTSATVFIYY